MATARRNHAAVRARLSGFAIDRCTLGRICVDPNRSALSCFRRWLDRNRRNTCNDVCSRRRPLGTGRNNSRISAASRSFVGNLAIRDVIQRLYFPDEFHPIAACYLRLVLTVHDTCDGCAGAVRIDTLRTAQHKV